MRPEGRLTGSNVMCHRDAEILTTEEPDVLIADERMCVGLAGEPAGATGKLFTSHSGLTP